MSRQERLCEGCGGVGIVQLDASYHFLTGRLVQEVADCPTCHGRGRVPLFLYAEHPPRSQRDARGLAEGRLLYLCWHGTSKQKLIAERELRRRDDS